MKFNLNSKRGVGALLMFCAVMLGYKSEAQGTWSALTNTAPHYNAGVMLVLTDGTVMCKTSSGGTNGKVWDKLTPDATGSYRNGTWTSLAAMADDRLYFSSQVLRDGRVYVAGGEYGSGGYAGEVYDPLTNTWTACGPLSGGEHISDANSDLLPDGRVLQAIVGSGSRRTYIWDPATNNYITGPTALGSHNESAWAKLPDNSILYVDIRSTNSERYIPATNSWIADGTVPVDLYDPFGSEMGGCFLLPDGRAYFIGAYGEHALYTPSGSTAPGTWAAAVATPTEGAPDAASSMCVDGKVLLTLSPLPTSADHFPPPTKFYEYDYLTDALTPVLTPTGGTSDPHSVYITNMVMLPDGNVLYTTQGDDQYYLYTPAGAPLAAGKPTVSQIFRMECDTFKATGTLFNGICQGASYGDDWQMNTNYPIIRLKSGTNVYYTRTTNWNSTGVMRGTQPDTTTFVLPAGLPPGTYQLEVVANGIASDPVTINTNLAITPVSSGVCAGLTTTLTATSVGGTWSSSNTAIGTVSPAGVVTGVAGGVVNITYSVGTCYTTATVTVGAMTPITPAGNVYVCMGRTATLSNSTPGGGWSSSNTSILTVAPGGLITGVGIGSANISYAIGSCYAIKTVTVSSLPLISITLSGPTTFCAGGSVTINQASVPGNTYQWFDGTTAISGATNSSYTATTTGVYSAEILNVAGCIGYSPGTPVTVNPGPPAVITPLGPTTFCSGGSVTLSVGTGTGYTYQWQLGGTDITGATSSSYNTSAGGNYTVVVRSGACSTTSSPVTVTVTAGPPAIITPAGPTTFCSPGSVVLNANTGAGYTYQWQVGSSNIPGATASSYTASASGSYTVVIFVGGCMVTSSPVTVTATVVTAGTISGGTGVCVSGTTALTSTVPGGTWTSSNTSLATIGSASGIAFGVSTGSLLISYTVTNSCGTATTSIPFGVGTPMVVSAISGASSLCTGGTTLLSDATPGGSWRSGNTAVATVGSSSGIVTGVATGSTTISYNVTSPLGCVSTVTAPMSVASTFTVTATPGGPTTFCGGGYVVLTSSTGSGMRYQWQRNGSNIAGATSVNYSASTTGNYTVVMTAPGGCNATSAAVPVTVTAGTAITPGVTISATPGTIFCTATSMTTLTAVPTLTEPSPVYQWYINGVPVSTSASYTYMPTVGDAIRVVLNSSATCAFPLTASAKDTIKLAVPRTPSVSIRASKSTACTGDSVTYFAVPLYGGTAPTYTWKENGVLVGGGPVYQYRPSSGDRLVVTMTSNYPCASTSVVSSPTYTVSVSPILPLTVTVNATNMSITEGTPDTFIAVAPYAGSSPGYQWYINGLPIAGATNSMYIAYALMPGQEIACRVTSSNPCVSPGTVLSGGVRVQVFRLGAGLVNQPGTKFSLVPNPNKGEFTIEGILASGGNVPVTVTIINMVGQTVHSEVVEAVNGKLQKRINLSNTIANGSYMVTVTSDADHAVYHIVVDR